MKYNYYMGEDDYEDDNFKRCTLKKMKEGLRGYENARLKIYYVKVAVYYLRKGAILRHNGKKYAAVKQR